MLKLCHGEKECHVMEQLRGDIASSRPMLTKGCCKGNNYEQRFALDTFPADFNWRNVLAKPCILLFTLQQECNTREACRLFTCCKSCICCFPKFSRNCVPASLVCLLLTWQQEVLATAQTLSLDFPEEPKNDGGRNAFHPPSRSSDRVDQFVFSTLRRRIGRPPGPPGCGGTSTTDRPWNSRWRKPHPDRRCWRRPVREDRCKYLLSYPLR